MSERSQSEPDVRAVSRALAMCLESRSRAAFESAVARVREEDPALSEQLRARIALLDAVGFLEDPDPEPGVPERIGGFRLIRRLGQGGMGTVFLAEQEALGRNVALKIVHPGLVQAERARQRFAREAVAAARIEHRCLCPIYEVGEADGLPYLAMRHVPGRTLESLLDDARRDGKAGLDLPCARESAQRAAVLELGRQLAFALHAAHQAGLVHRDVKPGNVIVTPAGDPVLVDFGLARLLEGEAALTLSGDRLGSPAYMAPEQVDGGVVDARTDVHALGALLWECLTLQAPFRGASREEVFHRILREPPDDPRIRGDLRVVLDTALAKVPAQRYASAAMLAEDLGRLSDGRPILARRTRLYQRVAMWGRRNPMAVVAIGILVLALIGTLALANRLQAEVGRANREVGRANRAVGRANRAVAVQRLRRALTDQPRLAMRGALDLLPEAAGTDRVDLISILQESLHVCSEFARLRHEDDVSAIEWLPDGARVLTASHDGSIRLWTRFGEPIWQWEQQSSVIDIDVSSDGRLFAAAHGAGGDITLFDAETLEEVCTYEHEGMVLDISFAPSDRRLLAVAERGPVRIWGEDQNVPLMEYGHHSGSVGTCAWSPDGVRVASATRRLSGRVLAASDVPELRIWNAATGVDEVEGLRHGAEIERVAFSPDGGQVLTACADGEARIWSVAGETMWRRRIDHDYFTSAAFAPDGRSFALGVNGGRAFVYGWDGEEAALVGTAFVAGRVLDLEYSADGGRLFVAARQGAVLDRYALRRQDLVGHDSMVLGATLHPDGNVVATAGGDGVARLWATQYPDRPALQVDRDALIRVRSLPDGGLLVGHPWAIEKRVAATGAVAWPGWSWSDGHLTCLCIEPGGRRAVVCDGSGAVRVIDSMSGEVECVLPVRDATAYGRRACWIGDGRILVGSFGSRRVSQFDAEGRPIPRTSKILRGGMATADWSASSRSVLIGFASGGIQLFDENLEPLACPVMPSGAARVQWAEFCPRDSSVLAAGYEDGRVLLWSAEDGSLLHRLPGHPNAIPELRWSPDGSVLATASTDSIRLWRFGEDWAPSCFAVLRGQTGAIFTITFGAEGRYLYAGTAFEGSIRRWYVHEADLVEACEERVGDDWTETERARLRALIR